MNFGEQSSSSKDVLQQKKLEYFGITSNFIQGKGKGKSTESRKNSQKNPNDSE